MKEPTERQKAQFRGIFGPGEFYLLVGPRGTGKTSFAAQIIDSAVMHGWYPEYEVATNILFKRKMRSTRVVGDDIEVRGTDNIVAARDAGIKQEFGGFQYTFEEYYPKAVHKVTSMSDVFHLIPDVLERGHILLLVVDEALQSEGFASGQSVLSADVRAVRSFASIIRKVNICVVLIAQSWRMVASSYRNADFITGIMRRRFDNQLVPGYGKREVIELIGPRGYEIKDERLIVDPAFTVILRTTPTGLATPIDLAGVGDTVFDTKSPAQFGMGTYRANGKKFQLFAAIGAISDVIEERAVASLRAHLANPPALGGRRGESGENGNGREGEAGEEAEDVVEKHRHSMEPTPGCPGILALKEMVRQEASDRKIERDSEYHFKKSTVRDVRNAMARSGEI